MTLGLPLTQFCVGESPEWHIARATSKNTDPCLAWRAHPNRAVIIAVGIWLVAEPSQFGVGAAIFADRLWRELDGAADAHESKELWKSKISPNHGRASTTDLRQAGKEMKFVITFGALSVITMAIWLFVSALEQSDSISLPTTLSAVKDLVDH
jgi:hypothetical protein